ncbi:MAG: hypothetical protein EOO45_25645, partial [Flavobacterium sp.]
IIKSSCNESFTEKPNRKNNSPCQSFKHMIGVALLAGIGFTMSLFISCLAFSNPQYVEQAKYGVLIASVLAGILGTLLLRGTAKNQIGLKK